MLTSAVAGLAMSVLAGCAASPGQMLADQCVNLTRQPLGSIEIVNVTIDPGGRHVVVTGISHDMRFHGDAFVVKAECAPGPLPDVPQFRFIEPAGIGDSPPLKKWP